MKGFLLTILVIACGVMTGNAQNAPTFTTAPTAQPPATAQPEPVDVPDVVVRKFVADFTNADHSEWKKAPGPGNNLEAFFTENDGDVRAIYSLDGTLMRTLRDVHFSILPTTAQDYITKNYAGQKTDRVWRITEHDGTDHYEVEMGKTKLKFDGQGNIVKPKVTPKAKTGAAKTTKK